MSPGEKSRHQFIAAMQAVLPGAQLARRRTWTVHRFQQFDGTVKLTLRSGQHSTVVYVPVCHTGPCLRECGLRPVALPPSQRTLL
jgi:hypothetical protein